MTRLHSRIYLHSLVVLLIVGLATSVVFVVGARHAFEPGPGDRIAQHVASVLGEHFGDRAELVRRVWQLHHELDVSIVVRDPDGRVLVEAGRHHRRGWHTTAPIDDPGSGAALGSVEVVHVGPPRGPWPLRPLVIVAIVLLVVGLATRPLARRISSPIERLTDAARRLGGGDLSVRVPVEDGARPRRWRDGRPVDELDTLTRAFNDMADRVEQIVRGQRELLASVSHELRSPLTRIRVALELLPRDAASEARLRDVETDLGELDRLIEDVLATARLDATGLPSRLARVEARALLTQVVERTAQDPVVHEIPVTIEDGPPLSVDADESLLRRALSNLVENAAKYGAPPIVLGATIAGDRVAFTVTDDGPGIPPADRERVFAPFERLDAARTPRVAGEPPRGVGLGLTLARKIAEAHGGTVTIGPGRVVDGVERGCRVTLAIPRAMTSA